ncbi:MAG: M20/M25/M40 family metallo-hydrolase [Candidatus Sulfopaludibacter sp.]|nr:M20/M25/M40 family metallo-hydrolase [Candidatus Sulfopaludibacter sp.]
MLRQSGRLLAVFALYCGVEALAQPPLSRLNPTIKQIVDQVSEERIGAIMKRLESFGTRYVGSEQDSETHGIGGAQRWILSEFQSYSPKLQVSVDKFQVKKSQRLAKDVELANVVAILPGTIDKDRYVMIGGHYDSIALRRTAGQAAQANDSGGTAADQEPLAPGVADDASGTAAVMELARVMSQYEFDKSIVFIAFAAEEIGLNGSRNYAQEAKEKNMQIEALLNNDIIGSDISGDGRSANNHLRVFSEGPEDSPSRALARYTKEIAERYVPSMTVDLVFRRDRFGRGGDHTSFNREGFTAVRLTTASENYANQHTATDTFANASVPFTTRAAKMNAAVLASLALAPKPPQVSRPRPAGRGAGDTATAGRGGGRRGPSGPGLSRGTSGYDAALRWAMPDPEPDIAGYAVVIRPTTSALWEREIYVGNVTEYTLPDLSIDDVVIGVKAIDKDGNQSLVSAYEQAPTTAGQTPAQTTQPRPPGGQ